MLLVVALGFTLIGLSSLAFGFSTNSSILAWLMHIWTPKDFFDRESRKDMRRVAIWFFVPGIVLLIIGAIGLSLAGQ